MRTREFTAGALLLLLAMMQMTAGSMLGAETSGGCAGPEYEARKVPERVKPVVIPELKSKLVKDDETLWTAYYDTMRILGSNNQCSAFFYGPEAAVYVFSTLMESVKRAHMPAGIGVKMSGDYTNILNAETQLKFRLFDRTSINVSGPFYQRKTTASGASIYGIGSFAPGSREARVLMLLHELGHLMRRHDGSWLLPDDGDDMLDSLKNTKKVESVCGAQIRDVSKLSADLEWVRQNISEQTVSPAAATSSH